MNPEIRRHEVVPWRDWEEFNKAYNDLFSDNIVQQRMALDQISVWRTRGTLPKAIEATDAIVSAIIQETLFDAGTSTFSELGIQMLNGYALVRFVCCILEPMKKTCKMSLSALAAKHNLPTWIIDLRNEVIHSHMPTRCVLRSAIDIALKYLKETFWSKVAADGRQIVYKSHPDIERKISDLLFQYKDIQFQIISEDLTPELSKNLDAVVKRMCFYIDDHSDIFIKILVQPGNFISAKDLKTLLQSRAIEFLELPNFILPEDLQRLWFPLLCQIHEKDLIPRFLESLLVAQGQCKIKICNKLAIAWGLCIYDGLLCKSLLTPIFLKKGVLFDIPCLVYSCVIKPNHYSKELLLRIIKKERDGWKYGKLCKIMATYLGYFLPDEDSLKREEDSELDKITFSADDLEAYQRNLIKKRCPAENKTPNLWSSPSVNMDFSSLPFGAIINLLNKNKGEKSSDDSWKKKLKLEPSPDDDFIIVDKQAAEEIIEETKKDEHKLSETIIPENFDMVYRKRQKK